MADKSIISRLSRNARKQREFRHIMRAGPSHISREVMKRKADIYFLRKYGGLSFPRIAKIFGISVAFARDIAKRRSNQANFSICHPKKSCM